jgi:tetratricopeptide (TPR) repeat protein
VPTIGLVQVGLTVTADRYLYLPPIGLSMALAWWAAAAIQRRIALAAATIPVLAALSVLAWQQTSYWRNSTVLWTHALSCMPDNCIAHNNLGNVLAGQREFAAAIGHYEKALQIDPNYITAHNNLGLTLARSGDYKRAIEEYRKAIAMRPGYVMAHNNLGVALAQLQDFDAAAAEFETAMQLKPDLAEARENLVEIRAQKKALRVKRNDSHAPIIAP